MKKHFLALAIAATAAQGAAAQSNVTIYGILDTGVAVGSGGPDGSVTKLGNGMSTSSRFGFKGSEDLGGGLTALFVLESGIMVDTGGLDQEGRLFGRQAWVGVKGAFGQVAMGRQYTPIYTTLTQLDPFGNNFGGASGRLMKQETGGTRIDNAVTYATPAASATSALAGFDAQTIYAFGEVPDGMDKSRQVGFAAGYKARGLQLRVAHHQVNNASATDRSKTTLYMAKYDFGPAIASIGYGVNKGLMAVDNRDLLLGITVPLGKHKLMASYIRKDDRNTATDFDASQYAVAYLYSLSKRTALYTAYSKLSNTRFTTSKFGPGDREIDVGMRHSF